MVHRQRHDRDLFILQIRQGFKPDKALAGIGHDIQMGQHGALRDTCRTSRVLQKCKICGLNGDRSRRRQLTVLKDLSQLEAVRQRVRQRHPLRFHTRPSDEAKRQWHEVSHTRQNHMAQLCPVDHLLQRVRKQVAHHNSGGTRVYELVLEFAWRVHRVDIDHHITRPQHAKETDRVLQQVGHHQSNPFAGRHAESLQLGRKPRRQLVQLAIGNGLAGCSADKCPSIGEFSDIRLKVRADGSQVIQANFCRNVFGITG